jgi:ferric-dicitrate binding protein FerR (iron transport regulator)
MSEFVLLPQDEEAAAWFAKQRRGVMTLEEREAFAQWQRRSGNMAAFTELERIWELLPATKGRFTLAALSEVPARRHRIARSALLVVVCAASIGLGVLSRSGNPEFWTTLDWVDR